MLLCMHFFSNFFLTSAQYLPRVWNFFLYFSEFKKLLFGNLFQNQIRDIKLANVVSTPSMCVKLIDFGSSDTLNGSIYERSKALSITLFESMKLRDLKRCAIMTREMSEGKVFDCRFDCNCSIM